MQFYFTVTYRRKGRIRTKRVIAKKAQDARDKFVVTYVFDEVVSVRPEGSERARRSETLHAYKDHQGKWRPK